MNQNISSALSDDGTTRALRGFNTSDFDGTDNVPQVRRYQMGEIDGAGLSTQVEVSDKGSRRMGYQHNNEMIEEVEDDESGRTGPPGTIGNRTIGDQHHDYMSENIESNVITRIKKGTENQSMKAAAGNGKSMQQNYQHMKQASDSSVENGSNYAVKISEKVRLTNDNLHIEKFKSAYDRVFRDFQDKLMLEYKLMKETYIAEYQENYQMNIHVKQENVANFMDTIEDRKTGAVELDKIKQQHLSMMNRFFQMNVRGRYYLECMKAWKAYIKRKREKNKKGAYTRNSIHRNRMSRFFKGWQKVSHTWG